MITHPQSYVYIIEDDKSTNELMAFLLRQKGYHPVQNFDGSLDLAAIPAGQPALFIVDLELPVVRGETLIDAIRANTATKDTPIVVITANKNVEEICQEHNIKEFLCKPFDVNDFKKILGKMAPIE